MTGSLDPLAPWRIGLALEGLWVPAWAAPVVSRLMDAAWASPVVLIPDGTPDGQGGMEPESNSGTRLFRAIESRLFPVEDDAFERIPLEVVLGSETPPPIATVDLTNRGEALRSIPEIDLVLEIVPQAWNFHLNSISKYGAWSCHSPRGDRRRPDRGGLQEVWEGQPVTAVTLTALTPSGIPLLLAQGWFQTDPLSQQRNQHRLYWKAGSLMTRELDEARLREHFRTSGRPASFRKNERIAAKSDDSPISPGFLESVSRSARAAARRKYNRWVYSDQWILLYKYTSDPSAPVSLDELQRIVPPADRFWADPHVIRRDGRYYVFLEEYLYSTRLGHISVMELDDQGGFTPPVPVLKRDDHLSYPFLFEYEGDLYMIPETLARKSIELYRCRRFPDQWEFVHALMSNVEAVDTTVASSGGHWWLFVAVKDNPGSAVSDELFLFHADSPLAQNWTEHPASPIVRDIRSARPAGGIFEREGKLFRPGQIGVPRYGYGINVHEITQLTLDVYEERLVHSITPDVGSPIQGTHTFTQAPGIIIMDGIFRRRVRPFSIV